MSTLEASSSGLFDFPVLDPDPDRPVRPPGHPQRELQPLLIVVLQLEVPHHLPEEMRQLRGGQLPPYAAPGTVAEGQPGVAGGDPSQGPGERFEKKRSSCEKTAGSLEQSTATM